MAREDAKSYFDALTGATFADLEFVQEQIATHPELRDVKIGFRPAKLRGIDVPDTVRVMYVRGEDYGAAYWYVVTWRGCDSEPKSIRATSEEMARVLVFNELRDWSPPTG